MRFFDKKLSALFVAICIPLLFLPKINLIRFRGETAGLRVDDFILAFFACAVFFALLTVRKKLAKIELWMGVIVAFSLLSFSCNQFLFHIGAVPLRAKIFYCLRLFEYFLFFYAGLHLFRLLKLRVILGAFLLWNLAIMLAQKFGVLGSILSEGYSENFSDRVTGVASFPSEMGAVLNLLFCALLFEDRERFSNSGRVTLGSVFESAKPYLLFLLCAVFIVLTGSRIAILALLLAMLFKVWSEVKTGQAVKLSMAGICLLLCLGVIPYIVAKTEAVFERSVHLFSFNNIKLVAQVWQDVDHIKDPLCLDVFKEGPYDMSWWIRLHKWCFALKTYFTHPQCWLQGLGPGFTSAALDGGVVRIITEYGIIGSFIFWKFFSALWRQSIQLKWMVIVLIVNMIFFDTYLAYKPMSLLFLAAGYSYASRAKESLVPTPV